MCQITERKIRCVARLMCDMATPDIQTVGLIYETLDYAQKSGRIDIEDFSFELVHAFLTDIHVKGWIVSDRSSGGKCAEIVPPVLNGTFPKQYSQIRAALLKFGFTFSLRWVSYWGFHPTHAGSSERHEQAFVNAKYAR